MSTQATTYDVFLSYSLSEGQIADLVARALAEAGLGVVSQETLQMGTEWRDSLWRSLAESDAIVAIIDPNRTLPSAIGVEVGAAMAWHKPVYVVHPETERVRLPAYWETCRVYPVSRIDDVVRSIKDGLQPLSEKERSVLRSVYAELGIPTDKLLQKPASIEELARAFNKRCGSSVGGERLVQELVRLRKSGNLGSLRS